MLIETHLKLNKFKPRSYQLDLCKALKSGKKKLLAIWPRRAGKDVCAFNLMIREAINKVGVYYYIFPTYSQARKVVWDSITNSGEKFLNYIPDELISSINNTEMKISFINNSIIQLIGSDNIDSLMGTNPIGIIFSEYALQDPRAYQFLRPILLANDGWAMFISTPRGRNNLFELYEIARNSPDWYCSKLTIHDTGHISAEEIQKEINEGLISEDLAFQEYYTSFDFGVEGSYYAKYVDKLRIAGQIGNVEHESNFKVHTSWDLGLSDKTTIIFFSMVGSMIRIIDYYENKDFGLDHYVKILQQKPYVYGKHIAPHDIRVREWAAGGVTRIEKARQLGVTFTIAPNLSVEDGIEAVRTMFPRLWIDDRKCLKLIKAMECYHREFDAKKKVYNDRPLHDWSSDACDALRMMALSLPKLGEGTTKEELDKRYRDAMYGDQLPNVFQQPNKYY